jgi:pimeloyl-ACP methyl ester carboxylesterase
MQISSPQRKFPTLIALHGAGMNASVWEPLKETLALQALDFPGHGEDKTRPLSSLEDMAQWVMHRIDGPCVLIGHSMGALAALEASTHPAVVGLILLGAAAAMPVHPDLLKQARENPTAAADLILKWGIYAAHPDAPRLRADLKDLMTKEATALASDLSACDAYRGGEAAARAFSKPVLVLAGENDKMAGDGGGAVLVNMFASAQLLTLPATGHMIMAENPALTAIAIKKFLQEISA